MSKDRNIAQSVVIALVNGAVERSRIREGLSGRFDVVFAARVRELEVYLQTSGALVSGVIVEESDADERSTCDTVRAIIAANAAMPIVGYCNAGIQHSNDIRALVVAGVHELLFKHIDDEGIALRAVLASAQRRSVGDVVGSALMEIIPDRLSSFVRHVVTHPVECQRVEQVALALGYHRKTLVNHCAQASLPPPQELLAWCRLALVGYLLGTTSMSIEAIAQLLDFPSDTALRNQMKRHVGLRATEVRARGGLSCVIEAFASALRAHGARADRRTVGP